MPPKAFPYKLRLGIDICHIPRIKQILTKRHAEGRKTASLGRFLGRVLTWPEQQYFWDRFRDLETAHRSIDKVSQYLAGRWAAKEACRKACDHLGKSNGLHRIMILPISTPESAATGVSSSEAPRGLILSRPLYYADPSHMQSDHGGAHPRNGEQTFFDINRLPESEAQWCEISISHDNGIAQAMAMVPILEKDFFKDTPEEDKS